MRPRKPGRPMSARRKPPGRKTRVSASDRGVVTARPASGLARGEAASRRIRVAVGSLAAIMLLAEVISVITAQSVPPISDVISRVSFRVVTSLELTTANPASLVVADFNQDGHLDLVVVPSTNVLRGNGTGTLAAANSTA